VGLVSPEFPPEKGGIQTYAWEFAAELARRGHAVTVFTQKHAAGELCPPEVRVESVLTLRRRLDRRIFHVGKIDVWHAMNAAYAWLALETQRVFVTVHGNDFLSPYFSVSRLDLRERFHLPFGSRADWRLGNWLTARLVHRALPHTAHIFANSHYTEQRFLRENPRCRGKTSAAMVGVSGKYFTASKPPRPDGPSRLITVCRLAEPHKNVDLVLRALARLRGDFDFRYTIVGDGYLRPELEQLTRELGIADRVEFTGFVEAETLHRLLLVHDLFVLTTSETPIAYEGFGIVYLEAAASGCPVLAARIGGAAEAVAEGVSGMFVDVVSVDSLEKKLRSFLSGKARFEAEACTAFARRFSWKAVVDHCLEHYHASAFSKTGGACAAVSVRDR
jgi:glycosyltransferase involved in cell wall biosynthesis